MSDPLSNLDPVLLEKWTQLFKFIDVDKDGSQTLKDYELMKEGILKNAKLTYDKRRDVLVMFHDMWFKHFEANPDDVLTMDQWMRKMKNILDSEDMVPFLTKLRSSFFYCMDLDGDGFIDYEEFMIFADVVGETGRSYVDKAFHMIDTDGDGHIYLDEYVNAYIRYVTDPTQTMQEFPLFGLPEGVTPKCD